MLLATLPRCSIPCRALYCVVCGVIYAKLMLVLSLQGILKSLPHHDSLVKNNIYSDAQDNDEDLPTG